MKMKKLLSGVLAAALMLIGPVQVFACAEGLDETNTFYYTQDEYTFEKLSHPEKDVKTSDGIVDYLGAGTVDVVTDPESEYYNAGARGQNYAWAALSYGDWLYVSTCYSNMNSTISFMKSSLGDNFEEDLQDAAFDLIFNGDFFNGEEDDGVANSILVKINTKTGETKLLMAKNLNNYGPAFRNGVVYKDKLYFCGSVREGNSTGMPSVWQVDPETDECKEVYCGIDNMTDYIAAYKEGISTGIRGMCIYEDQLVISNVTMDAATGKSSATILISSDPEQGFTQIADSDDLFGYPAYHYCDSIYGGSIWEMVEFNGSLYVSICTGTPDNMPDDNTMQSFAIVRGDQNEDGSFTWTALAGDQEKDGARYCFGIDPERTRSGAATLMVYGDYLYIGEYNDEEIALERILFDKTGEDADGEFFGNIDCGFMNANLDQSVNLYRMDKDENVELVVGDKTEMFPDGSLSGLGSGFGRNENQYIWRMEVYEGKLYVGTFDTSSLLQPIGQLANGDLITQSRSEWKSQIEYLKTFLDCLNDADENTNWFSMARQVRKVTKTLFKNMSVKSIASILKMMNYLRKAERGFDLYVTEDGINFETVTTDGFGDPYNHGLRVFATTDQGLCIGTANPFYGTQIWIQRAE